MTVVVALCSHSRLWAVVRVYFTLRRSPVEANSVVVTIWVVHAWLGMSTQAWASQARTGEWVTTRYLTVDSIVEIWRKSGSWIKKNFATVRRPSQVLSTVDRRPSHVYHINAQLTPPDSTRQNCRVESFGRCELRISDYFYVGPVTIK